jgi:hypothetical protein
MLYNSLAAAGLLPLARMVEATEAEVHVQVGENDEVQAHRRERSRRFPFDRSLLTALVDRWRPETHTFHLPWGEMAPTLQDVSALLGLPMAGEAVGPSEAPAQWRSDLDERFEGVLPPGRYTFVATRSTSGPSLVWIRQFRVS